jgi:hypothetical protein
MADCNVCTATRTCEEYGQAEKEQLAKRRGNKTLDRFRDKIRRTGCFKFKKE